MIIDHDHDHQHCQDEWQHSMHEIGSEELPQGLVGGQLTNELSPVPHAHANCHHHQNYNI